MTSGRPTGASQCRTQKRIQVLQWLRPLIILYTSIKSALIRLSSKVHNFKLALERVQACILANISRSRYVAMATQPVQPTATPPNSAQLGGIPTTPPSYSRVRAIVWACGRGQTDTQTHRHTQTHRRAWPQYISRCLRLTRNVTTKLSRVAVIPGVTRLNLCCIFQ